MDNSLKKYYKSRNEANQANYYSVGWKSQEAQEIRFVQLLKILTGKEMFSINDLGCGLADLYFFLKKMNYKNFIYQGYDQLESMVINAKKRIENLDYNIDFIKDEQELKQADYTVASGIFNLKYSLSENEWQEYMKAVVLHMNKVSTKGFAFNALTSYSDIEYQKEELFYSDPLFWFDFCKKNCAFNVALLHDYNQYDFTILVRK